MKTTPTIPSDFRRVGPNAWLLAVPIVTKSEANQRSRIAQWRRGKDNRERLAKYLHCLAIPMGKAVPSVVRFTRIGRKLLDDDNLAGAMKHLRDEVAKYFGVDDGPKGPIRWEYSQREWFAVGVEIEFLNPPSGKDEG